MNRDQKYTPKYWVVHDKTTDDIMIETMSKSKSMSIAYYNEGSSTEPYGSLYFEEDNDLGCILIEIKEVRL